MSKVNYTFSTTWLAVALSVACSGGCVQVMLRRDTQLQPLPPAKLALLEPGVSTLQSALEQLGPPLLAWELPEQGVALAWGWSRNGGWGVMVSVPLADTGGSLSADYSREGLNLRGAVLFFDRNWQLTSVREGLLRELRNSSRPRPEFVEDEPALP